jgi:hypothetical protein
LHPVFQLEALPDKVVDLALEFRDPGIWPTREHCNQHRAERSPTH